MKGAGAGGFLHPHGDRHRHALSVSDPRSVVEETIVAKETTDSACQLERVAPVVPEKKSGCAGGDTAVGSLFALVVALSARRQARRVADHVRDGVRRRRARAAHVPVGRDRGRGVVGDALGGVVHADDDRRAVVARAAGSGALVRRKPM